MAEYTAYFITTASAAIKADVPDDVAAEGAEAISEWICSNRGMPRLCAQCSGWGQEYNVDLGEWEPETHAAGEHDGAACVSDADGNDVTG